VGRGDDRRGRRRAPGRTPLSAPRVTAHLFDADGRDHDVELEPTTTGSLGDRQLLWVDIDREEGADLADVGRSLGLDAEELARLQRRTGMVRLLRSEDRLHLTVESLEVDEGDPPKLERRELDLLAGPNVVVTVHEGPIEALEQFAAGLTGETRLGALDAADLLSALVDELLGGYFRVTELIEREIDDLDQRALRSRPEDDILARIVALRRRIGLVRRTLAPHREALAALARPEMKVEELIGQPWTGLPERLERALDAVESLRSSLLGTYDIHMGRVAQRANDVMKLLTLLSAILLPAVVLAGIMGMNFQLPFFDEASNFLLVLAAMVALAGLILGVARWRRWL
jgi:Mg2+ and Co2+ transporter CorA